MKTLSTIELLSIELDSKNNLTFNSDMRSHSFHPSKPKPVTKHSSNTKIWPLFQLRTLMCLILNLEFLLDFLRLPRVYFVVCNSLLNPVSSNKCQIYNMIWKAFPPKSVSGLLYLSPMSPLDKLLTFMSLSKLSPPYNGFCLRGFGKQLENRIGWRVYWRGI